MEAEGLVRDGFAVMVKLSGLLEDFNTMVNEIEHEGEETALESLKTKAKYEQIHQKWTVSSRMRTWFAEKKKNIAEMVSKRGAKEEEQEALEREELEKVIQRVKTKAELLLKLNRPRIW